jgi:8-oxo-dGTP pyrophosphatase MutT (NUDIX family)
MFIKYSDSYFDDQDTDTVTKSIFLAGPTPRSSVGDTMGSTWRHVAVEALRNLGYDGTIYIPIPEKHFQLGNVLDEEYDYENQVEWEKTALDRADVIFFYVARTEENPGLTTNIEFGRYIDSGRVVYARPHDAISVRYLDDLAKRFKVECFELENGLKQAVERIGEGAERKGLECKIPLLFWKSDQFQDWWITHKNQGNRVLAFEVKSVITLDNFKELFGFSAWVSIWIKNEDREKSCEWIFSRTHATYTVPFFTNPDGSRSYVLVRDFRSTSTNKKGYVYELPGGSWEKGLEPRDNAAKELYEEIGIDLVNEKDRLKQLASIQPYAIFAINLIIPFVLELTLEEFNFIMDKVKRGEELGEDAEERIKLCVMNERSIYDNLESFPVDLMTLGLIRLSDAHCPRKQPVLPRLKMPRTTNL